MFWFLLCLVSTLAFPVPPLTCNDFHTLDSCLHWNEQCAYCVSPTSDFVCLNYKPCEYNATLFQQVHHCDQFAAPSCHDLQAWEQNSLDVAKGFAWFFLFDITILAPLFSLAVMNKSCDFWSWVGCSLWLVPVALQFFWAITDFRHHLLQGLLTSLCSFLFGSAGFWVAGAAQLHALNITSTRFMTLTLFYVGCLFFYGWYYASQAFDLEAQILGFGLMSTVGAALLTHSLYRWFHFLKDSTWSLGAFMLFFSVWQIACAALTLVQFHLGLTLMWLPWVAFMVFQWPYHRNLVLLILYSIGVGLTCFQVVPVQDVAVGWCAFWLLFQHGCLVYVNSQQQPLLQGLV